MLNTSNVEDDADWLV